jgi:hypothetical protein
MTAADGDRFCNIGRLAEVRFHRPILRVADAYFRFWRWFHMLPHTSIASN